VRHVTGSAAVSLRPVGDREADGWFERVEVEFVEATGAVVRELERRVRPVRGFSSFRGQRNWPGLWSFSRTGEQVGYESWVERPANGDRC